MTKQSKTGKQLCVLVLCIASVACASTPEADRRPTLIQTAEKSLELGVSNYRENDFHKAESHFNRALELYRSIDNPEGIVSSCLNLAKTRLQSGQADTARAYVNQAEIIINREQLHSFDEHLALIQSSIAIESGSMQQATDMLDKLLNNVRPDTNASVYTAALQNRTRVAFITGANDATDWTQQYRNALKKPSQNTDLNQARLSRFEAALQPDKAPEKLEQALKLYRQVAHAPGIAATLAEWSSYDALQGHFDSAVDKLKRALFIRASLRDRKNSQQVLQQLSSAYTQLGNTRLSERASNWQQKLETNNFNEWNSVTFDFEDYPR